MTPARVRPAGVSSRQMLSAFIYVGVIGGLLNAAYMLGTGLVADQARVAVLRERIEQLSDRAKSSANAPAAADADQVNSPFLEGETAALAGAGLQQHIERVVTDAGGALLSSEINLDESESKNRFLSLTVSTEMTQLALQSLLYTLEAGMPYLFVNSFEAQTPEAFDAGNGRMRVTMNVSGQWEPPR
jgi:general secretion pathway protein M